MNDKVIYTSLTGGYDKLPQYDVIDPEFDYICFTNDFPDNSRQGIWTIKSIPFKFHNDLVLSRYAKLMPHKVLSNYEVSLWLDSNIQIKDLEFYSIIKSRIEEGGLWFGIKHPWRDCIYDEAQNCVIDGKANIRKTINQLKKLKEDGFPEHYGLFENNIILRRHNESTVIDIDNKWWELFNNNKYTHRDQLSLYYIFWKYNFLPRLLLSEDLNSRNNKFLSYCFHKKKPFYKRLYIRIRGKIINCLIDMKLLSIK